MTDPKDFSWFPTDDDDNSTHLYDNDDVIEDDPGLAVDSIALETGIDLTDYYRDHYDVGENYGN